MNLQFFCILFVIQAVIGKENGNLTQKPEEYWDVKESAQVAGPGVRLPSDVIPSFYRLKIKADLETSTFSGDVYITIHAKKKVKEIVLHSKDLSINDDVKLTEQIYEKVETLRRFRREALEPANVTAEENKTAITEATTVTTLSNTTLTTSANTTTPPSTIELSTVTDVTKVTTSPIVTESRTNLNDSTQRTEPPATTQIDVNTQVTHSIVRSIKIVSIKQSIGDQLILTLASSLKPNVDYTLEISFAGNISEGMTGFYKSTYKNDKQEIRTMASTQFQPISARRAFPCFDEPVFKAQFEISIAHKQNLTVLSNMKILTQEPIADEPGWQWTHFDRSVKMSTYLVAYVICDFKSLETSYLSKDNITKPIRVWVRPELLEKTSYVLKITPKLLEYYEDLFGLPYALDKLDLVGIPDFSSGAMENWGLITFRETYLVVDPQGSARERVTVGVGAAHELAHQWFGNLVTMRWWTDLWLNEGFATYIEHVGLDHVEPDLKILESFSREKMDLFRSDALKNTQPVSQAVTDAADIAQKFNELSYQKGSNLIRMLNHTMSEELFRKGLVHYLNKWKYSNAEENDLWAAMSTAAESDPVLKGRSIVKLMNSWTRQAGYPVVNVIRNYETGDVQFEQSLFSVSDAPYSSMTQQLWQIPISYSALPAPGAMTRPSLWLTTKSLSTKLMIATDYALYVNVEAIGYYRVNYDQNNWRMLSEALQSGHVTSAVTRAQLLDDAFNLAKAGQLSYNEALNLTTYAIDGEDSKTVWNTILGNMGFLKTGLTETPAFVKFQDYMRLLISKQLEKLHYGLEKPKDDNEALLVEGLVSWDCEMESPRCRDWAVNLFNEWMNSNGTVNSIPVNLRHIVYGTALRYGGRREFDFVLQRFYAATDPIIKERLISSLPYVRDNGLLTLLFEKSLSEIPKQYSAAVWSTAPVYAARTARSFLLQNFERVHRAFTALDEFMFRVILDATFDTVTTQADLDTLKSFALEHAASLRPERAVIARLVDTASLRVRWGRIHAQTIHRWLTNFLDNRNNPNNNSTIAPSNNATLNNATESNTVVSNVTTSNTTESNVTTNSTPASNVTTNSTTASNVTTNSTPTSNVTTNSTPASNVTASVPNENATNTTTA